MSAVIHVIKLFCREFAWLTGSLLKITRHKLPNSTDRILFIYGTVAAITTCLEAICALVREIKGRSNEIPYIPPSENANAYTEMPSYPQGLKFVTSMNYTPSAVQNGRRSPTDSKVRL
ncbi:unnamed protein product [Hydatigera taeniaeformis]|uniref:Uncharacterized protein n=1 Tax=Hydatigena taeniaeformis TaxID=6205 RepID=A0A0R3XB16_HYDTA|nr:unnamed protein product [Hydatigera taeniaeformis]